MRSSPEGSGLAAHLQLFRGLGVNPIEVFRNTPGKNAADIALVIDMRDPGTDNTNGLDNVSINATSAVPEPSSVAFLGSALGVLAFWSRKRTYRG